MVARPVFGERGGDWGVGACVSEIHSIPCPSGFMVNGHLTDSMAFPPNSIPPRDGGGPKSICARLLAGYVMQTANTETEDISEYLAALSIITTLIHISL